MNGKQHRPPWWRRDGRGHQARLRRYLTEMVDGAGWADLVIREAFEHRHCRPGVVLGPPA